MRWMLWASLATLVASSFMSGCLEGSVGSGDDTARARGQGLRGVDALPIPEGWSEFALAGGEGHDHFDPAQHKNRSTPNFHIIGYEPLITDYYGRTAGGHFCGDVRERDGRALSVVHSWVTDIAMIITDVTDPAEPKKLGELQMANTHVYDLIMTDDQQYVLLATSPLGTTNLVPDTLFAPWATFRDACTGEVRVVDGPEQGLPFASGVVLVDISNPRVPAIVDFVPFPVLGGHSVQTAEIDGRNLVLVSVPNPGVSYYVIAEVVPAANGGKLVPLSYYQYRNLETMPPTLVISNLHDGYIQKHPVTGQVLGYLAYGTTGIVIIDITDPSNPEFVSHWADFSALGRAAPGTPFFHEALPMPEVWDDGRHYTFVGEECGSARPATPTCLAFILDTTDPAKPTMVGAWTLPHEVEWSGGLMYSLHYLAVTNGTFFVTNYHGGLWAVDVSTPEARRMMPSIGVFMPDRESPRPIPGPHAYGYAPVVLDLNVLSDGTLVGYDGTSGLYTVRFDPSDPAPSPPVWPLGYNE